MATTTFTLDVVDLTPPYRITVTTPDGATRTWEWVDIEELRAWYESIPDISKLNPEVVLRWMIKVLRQTDPDLSSLPSFVGHTFRFTEPTVEDLG
jgi:hypothetical protein